jgi:serine protease Do
MRFVAALLFLTVAAGVLPARAQDAADRTKVVNCFDAGRNLVKRVPLWQCKGEAISDEDADEVRKSRILRAKNKMVPKASLYDGLKMVSSGSGFFVSKAGHLVTNHHVIDDCRKVSIKPTAERDHAEAEVIGSDQPDDLAVLRYSRPAPAVAVFRKPIDLDVGDRIAVVGHPLHGLVAIKPIFVTGKVRAFEPDQMERWGRFAIDADIRRGNSGGPVVDGSAYIVGVVSAKINTPAMFQRTGEVIRNIGIVIRQDRVLRFLERFNVAYTGDTGRPDYDDDALFGVVQTFVARVGCWK